MVTSKLAKALTFAHVLKSWLIHLVHHTNISLLIPFFSSFPNKVAAFKVHALGLLSVLGIGEFNKQANLIIRDFPKLKAWMEWWMHPSHTTNAIFISMVNGRIHCLIDPEYHECQGSHALEALFSWRTRSFVYAWHNVIIQNCHRF